MKCYNAAMGFFLRSIYTLTSLGFLSNIVLGYLQLQHHDFAIVHLSIGLATTFLGVFVTMLSTSYFLATRDRLTEEGTLEKIPQHILEEAKKIKKALFSACGPSMILILLNATLAGTTFAGFLPPLPHHIVAYLALMAHIRAFRATSHFIRFRPQLFQIPA